MSTSLEKMIAASLLVPLDDPMDKHCRMGLNLMLWGDPGIGKSDRVESAAAAVGLRTYTVFAATCQPEDASGVAFPNSSKGVAMLEGGLSELHAYLDKPIDLVEGEDKVWGMPRKLVEPARILATKILSRVLKVSLKYGPHLSSLEPTLPGIRELVSDDGGVLFLDELSCARPAVQAAFLGVALYRKVGGIRLPPRARVIAAANPPESAAGGWELEPPMANRFCHFDVHTPKLDEWGAWLMNDHGEELEAIESGEARVRQNWSHHWAITKGNVLGFLQTQPSLLHKMPDEGHKDRGKAWPSPRTWAFLTRALTTCKCLDTDAETTAAFLKGCVGEAAAKPLITWMLKADLPHPLDALKNGWEPDKLRLDRCQAVYSSVVAYVITRDTEKERHQLAPAAWSILNGAMQAGQMDLVVDKAKSLVSAGLDTKTGIDAITQACQPVMVQLAKRKAGNFLAP